MRWESSKFWYFVRLILEIYGSNTDGLRACRLLHCNIGYPSKIHLECKFVKILLAITSVSVAPLLWNFARCMAVSLPCTVQNFATMGQLRNKLGAIRFLWDLYPYIVTAPWCWDFMCRGNSIKHYYECSLIDMPLWKWLGQRPSGWINPCSAQNLFQKVNEIHPRKSYYIMIHFSTRQSCPVVNKAWFNTVIFSTTVPKVKKRPDFNLTETVTIGNLQCCKVGE